MTHPWLWSNISSSQWLSSAPLLLTGQCCLPVWPSTRLPWPSPCKLLEGRVLGRRGFALESAVAGARLSVSVFLHDLDLPIGAVDLRQIEVIAEGLPVFHWVQLAIDATLVSPLRADGEPHRRCPDEDGAALTFARRRKERTNPELATGRGRARLVVIAATVLTVSFSCLCAKNKIALLTLLVLVHTETVHALPNSFPRAPQLMWPLSFAPWTVLATRALASLAEPFVPFSPILSVLPLPLRLGRNFAECPP